MRWLVVLLILSLAGCATKMGKDGRTQTTVDAKYLVKSDVDRIADTARAEVIGGLLLIADKLYKRNPKELKKGTAVSREAAVDRLRQRNSRSWPEFGGLRERQAAALAFSSAYDGDRVAALAGTAAALRLSGHRVRCHPAVCAQLQDGRRRRVLPAGDDDLAGRGSRRTDDASRHLGRHVGQPR